MNEFHIEDHGQIIATIDGQDALLGTVHKGSSRGQQTYWIAEAPSGLVSVSGRSRKTAAQELWDCFWSQPIQIDDEPETSTIFKFVDANDWDDEILFECERLCMETSWTTAPGEPINEVTFGGGAAAETTIRFAAS